MNVANNHAMYIDSESWNKMSLLERLNYDRVPDTLVGEVNEQLGDNEAGFIKPKEGGDLQKWVSKKRTAKSKAKRRQQSNSRKQNRK
jgi:hypothetical protein